MPIPWRRHVPFFVLLFAFSTSQAQGRDWVHWRGPEQNGVSREKNLPDEFEPKAGAKGNVIWQQPYGGRSAPLVLDGKVYILQGTSSGIQEGEQVVCFDEKSGKPLWHYKVNVFQTDIVSNRLGWTTLTADPETKYVYAHTTAGLLLCLDQAGKLVWSHSLTEEYGRISGYGGRNVTPLFDSGLVIVGMVSANWGDHARGANRFVAFDGKTGEVVWWADTAPNPIEGTYYSSPVVAVIGGQRVMISGGADGYLHAFKIRTGERLWSYRFANGVVNGSPLVDGNLVYCHHGEDNPEGGAYGRVICVDAGQVNEKTKTPKLVWEYRKSKRFGLASGALDDGRLYVPDDSGTLYCFDAKDGKVLWTYRYATEVRGAPLVADGKIYLFDVKGKMNIILLDDDRNKQPDEDDTFVYKFRLPSGLLNETNGTPIAVNNRVYFTTGSELLCIGYPDAKDECGKYEPLPEEAPVGPVAGVRLFPADVVVEPGKSQKIEVVTIDANGRKVAQVNKKLPNAEWSLPLPPKAPTGAQPPALKGKVDGDFTAGTLTVDPTPTQQGSVAFKSGDWTAQARVRVAATIPYTQDFEKLPPGAVPGGWVNAQGKYLAVKLPDGNIVLAKRNDDARPPFARARAYMTTPWHSNYTVQADMMGTEVGGKLPDVGLVNTRYRMILDGKTDPTTKSREIRLASWEARQRIYHGVAFDWKPKTWYTAKFTVEQTGKTAMLRAKVWEKGTPEPEKWMIEFEDPNPNPEGAAALYGYVSNIVGDQPGSEAYFDNVKITPNGK